MESWEKRLDRTRERDGQSNRIRQMSQLASNMLSKVMKWRKDEMSGMEENYDQEEDEKRKKNGSI